MSLNMAIIGYGGMAGWHHRAIKKDVPEIKITAAYDILDESKENILANGLKLYKSPDDLYNDESISVVLITTPNDVHAPYAISCMKAGKHVICEKPATLNAAELEEVIAVSKETGMLFAVHQNRRWDTDFLTIKRILADGILNDPYHVERWVGGSRQVMHGWRSHKINGGGMVLDWGAHLLDQMLQMVPANLVSIYACLHNVHTGEVDDNIFVNLLFSNGFTATVGVFMNSFILRPHWLLYCKDGTAVVEDWESNGKIVKLADPDILEWEEEIVYTAAGPTRSMAPRPKDTTEEHALPYVHADWLDFHRNFVKAIDGKAELVVKPEQTLRLMKVIDAVFESDRIKASVTVDL